MVDFGSVVSKSHLVMQCIGSCVIYHCCFGLDDGWGAVVGDVVLGCVVGAAVVRAMVGVGCVFGGFGGFCW